MSTRSRTPELEEVLSAAVEYYLQDLHTCMPARVESYDADLQMVDAKPVIQRRVRREDGTEDLEDLPIIPNVPLVFPRAGKFFFSMPVDKGDQVMLHFSMASLDAWLSGSGDSTDPKDIRLHDITDAIAVPGLYTFSKAIRDIHKAGLRMGEDEGGIQVSLNRDGTMEVSVDGQSEDAAMLGQIFKIWWNSSISPWLASHIHPTGVGPSGPPSSPVPAFEEDIISRILKLRGP